MNLRRTVGIREGRVRDGIKTNIRTLPAIENVCNIMDSSEFVTLHTLNLGQLSVVALVATM